MKPLRVLAFATLASASIVLAGCQTPPAVYDLADKTSANSAVFQQHLADLSTNSRELAQARATHVASMDAFNATLDSFIKRELYMRQRSNLPADWSRMDAQITELAALRDELQKIELAAAISERQRSDEILAARIELNTYTSAMRDAANALSALATPESSAERARFTAQFALDVTNDVRASLKESDKASQAAKKLIDKVKGDLKASESTDAEEKPADKPNP